MARLGIGRRVPEVTAAPRVDVVLATYQGGRFLREQLDSIAAQEGVAWRLFVRDDGSADATLGILDTFGREHEGHVEILSDGETGLGAASSFDRLLRASTAPYVFTCDQDDIWAPRKLAVSVERLQALEARFGSSREILVHTDLLVIDEARHTIAPSMNRFGNLGAHSRTGLRHMLVQNCVTGCTAGMNRALLERALPVPEDAIMHDWWLALVAAAFGSVAFIPEATVEYRQHGSNTIGARRYGLQSARSPGGMRESLRRTFVQAAALRRELGAEMRAPAATLVERYAGLSDASGVGRRWRVARHGFWKHGVARNLAMLVVL